MLSIAELRKTPSSRSAKYPAPGSDDASLGILYVLPVSGPGEVVVPVTVVT